MASKISFSAKSGAASGGEIALPAGSGKAPAVVLIQEWWGLDDHIRSLLDRLAAAGFLAVAPDLYHGTVTKDAGEAGKLMQELDGKRAMDDIAGAVHFAMGHEHGNGKVAVMGFCMGGAYSFAAASAIPELAAAVSFYGVPPADRMDFAKMKTPILAHVATRDEWVTVAKVEAIQKGLAEHGHAMRLEVYEADHAFVNDTRPAVYAPDAAKLAWERSLAFLHQHLG